MSAKRDEILKDLFLLGRSIGDSLPEMITDEDLVEVFANQLIDLRNEILSTTRRDEAIKVLDGFLYGIGYEIDADGYAVLVA